MSNTQIETKPSDTALFTALRRTIANRMYPGTRFGADHLAEIFLPGYFRFFLKSKKIQLNTKEKLNAAMPGMNEYIIARTIYFDDLFRNALAEKVPQIVLLGAGYDSRAYRFAKQNEGTKIFELDAPPTQERKIKCLQAGNIPIPSKVQFVPINFASEKLPDILENAGYQPEEKTLFLWEGVSMYLPAEAVKETLDFVGQSGHKDTIIAFDFTVTLMESNSDQYYGADVFLQSMKEHHAQEGLMFSLADGEIRSFLAARHLELKEILDHNEIELKHLLDDSGELIGRMSGIFRFASACPK